jgi:hypothetical protein
MTDPNFRALCAELLSYIDYINEEHRLPGSIYADRARAALAQPEPVGDKPLQQDQHCLAAALRAAVAQTQHPGSKHYRGFDNWQCDAAELLAIAEELEGAND